jgi:glycerophosphoryl diester phosphodiesterase
MHIIAHRGASAIYPENTLSAFTQALAMGAHGLELDIQCSSDGQAVVFHDDTLERITNGTGNISHHTWHDLQKLRVEEDERILSLAELFDHFAGKTTLWLEIKNAACIDELIRCIEKAVQNGSASYEQCIVIGFDSEVLHNVRTKNPHILIGYSLEHLPSQEELHTHIQTLQPAYVLPYYELASQEFVHEMAAQGIQTVVWTLNEINDSLRMQQRGVHGIITDVPNILYELFHG